MRRATLACASLLLMAGLTACGNDDSADDAKDDASTSRSATASDSTSASEDDSPSETDATPDPTDSESADSDDGGEDAAYCSAVADAGAASDAGSIEDLRTAVDALDENLPDAAGDEAEDGLDHLQERLGSAQDLQEFTKMVQGLSKEDQADVQAYSDFEDATCASAEAPSESAS
ncbi:hypothetical protein ncot_00535 [Nocardioides sp. JQ2195]|uniref:hypothetical protein n=1 Tax=Nocardioides sp. JQ2195 TaxID=2592334 RepID=UPI00143E978D|nr:hypothetical protein [Nocardioides sp. JQ2195]QIX25238.1 hypothetical protein ncot_00535 [Nocardioides sp. JQ2195]